MYPIILIRSDRSTIFDNNSEVMGRWWAETEYIIDFYEEFGGREFFAFRLCGVFTCTEVSAAGTFLFKGSIGSNVIGYFLHAFKTLSDQIWSMKKQCCELPCIL